MQLEMNVEFMELLMGMNTLIGYIYYSINHKFRYYVNINLLEIRNA